MYLPKHFSQLCADQKVMLSKNTVNDSESLVTKMPGARIYAGLNHINMSIVCKNDL